GAPWTALGRFPPRTSARTREVTNQLICWDELMAHASRPPRCTGAPSCCFLQLPSPTAFARRCWHLAARSSARSYIVIITASRVLRLRPWPHRPASWTPRWSRPRRTTRASASLMSNASCCASTYVSLTPHQSHRSSCCDVRNQQEPQGALCGPRRLFARSLRHRHCGARTAVAWL